MKKIIFAVFSALHLIPLTQVSLSYAITHETFDTDALSHMSSLEQFRSGIKAEDVKCNSGFILVINRHYLPACVTEPSTEKILLRGWQLTISDL